MKITEIISKSDLGEPYDRLSDFLDLDDIVKVEQAYSGRQLKFKRDRDDKDGELSKLKTLLGTEKAEKFVMMLGGMWIYFPKLRRSAFDKIKTSIKQEFRGHNYYQLAVKYGYTERHIRRIVADEGKSNKIHENQMSIFDVVDDRAQ